MPSSDLPDISLLLVGVSVLGYAGLRILAATIRLLRMLFGGEGNVGWRHFP